VVIGHDALDERKRNGDAFAVRITVPVFI